MAGSAPSSILFLPASLAAPKTALLWLQLQRPRHAPAGAPRSVAQRYSERRHVQQRAAPSTLKGIALRRWPVRLARTRDAAGCFFVAVSPAASAEMRYRACVLYQGRGRTTASHASCKPHKALIGGGSSSM